ncbi:MAG: hypothetical protein Q8L29_01285 [archaeon]|nr:hypothetical protein [archaeon]
MFNKERKGFLIMTSIRDVDSRGRMVTVMSRMSDIYTLEKVLRGEPSSSKSLRGYNSNCKLRGKGYEEKPEIK